jgi:hypothetical protein
MSFGASDPNFGQLASKYLSRLLVVQMVLVIDTPEHTTSLWDQFLPRGRTGKASRVFSYPKIGRRSGLGWLRRWPKFEIHQSTNDRFGPEADLD